MKIPSHSHRTAPSRDRSTPSKAEKAEKSGAGAGRPAAKVQVSGGARALEGLRAPEQVDSAKVARLRQAIDNGEFEVDADRIAERMLEEERVTELLTALAELLRREREAALAGDLEALEELQSEKREAVDALLEAAPDDPDAIEALAVDARANVVLIRQLVGIHRALAGLEPSGYGADGRSQPPHAAGATRGVL